MENEDKVPQESAENITVETLKDLVKKTFEFRAKLDLVKKQKTEMEAEFKVLTGKILQYLEDLELDNFKVPGFGNAIVNNKWSVKVPKDPDKKAEFFAYLHDQGQFMELVSVNVATLNSYYKEQMADAIDDENSEFKIPGLEEPLHYQTLQLRKG